MSTTKEQLRALLEQVPPEKEEQARKALRHIAKSGSSRIDRRAEPR